MARRPDTLCAGPCGRLLWSGSTPLPAGQRMCLNCRRAIRGLPPGPGRTIRRYDGATCLTSGCVKPARSLGMCKTHYNKATGHYIGAVEKDPERERARLRLKTHRRKDWSRLTDVTAEYELALRARAKRCPLCKVTMTDEPYLPHSKETDHIIPRGAGGTHTIGNLRVICRSCNLARPADGSDYTGPVTLWAEVA